MKDMRIIPNESGDVTFELLGGEEDTGLMLLQRLYVLMLSQSDGTYRYGTDGALLQLLEGGNNPPAGVLNALLSVACANALNALDEADRVRISSFKGSATDSGILCTLELMSGTVLEGVLING